MPKEGHKKPFQDETNIIRMRDDIGNETKIKKNDKRWSDNMIEIAGKKD